MTYVTYEISLAKERFANQLIRKSISQTESELDNFFDRIEDLINAVEQQYSTEFWEKLPVEMKVLHAASFIENYAPVSSIGFANEQGHELNILPDTVAGQWLTREVFVDRWGFIEKWTRWRMAERLQPVEHWQRPLLIDPRERPWYSGAMQASGKTFWTNPYQYTTGPQVGITASTLMQENTAPGDTLSQILAFDLTLDDLNGFIDGLHLTENQNIFLLDGNNSKVIAFNNYAPSLSLNEVKSTILISPEKLGSRTLLTVLKSEQNEKAFSFEAGGQTWWGFLRPYELSDNRKIHIVSVLPEADFALGMNQTLWVVIGSFILIMALSFIVVWNHNKLHRIGGVLSEKNKLISEQKKFLFSEVHHRVKNNLALISAFLQLEQLNTKESKSGAKLRKNQHRIKIIALAQEEAYKADQLGMLPLKSLVHKIVDFAGSKVSGTDYELTMENDTSINVNQALVYGLLLNEIIHFPSIPDEDHSPDSVSINVTRINSTTVVTHIHIQPAFNGNWLDTRDRSNDILKAFLTQLNAHMETRQEEGLICTLRFDLKAQKGAAGNVHYKHSDKHIPSD